jgi:diguanylate cyclase (GGDEF)-like protein
MVRVQTRRAEAFTRFFVALIFILITAIGSFAIFAMAAGQTSGDRASYGYARANQARLMALALDRGYNEVLGRFNQTVAERTRQFIAADSDFDTAFAEYQRIPGTKLSDQRDLWANQERFFQNGRGALEAAAQGDRHRGGAIEAASVRPLFTAVRNRLDFISSSAFEGSLLEEDSDRETTLRMERLIGCATLFALVLMSWLATLLSRYRRAAVAASEEKVAALEQAALTDSLTLLGNHRAFSDDFAREIARAKRNHHALTLALIDVDDFKAVNDTRGHAHGDDVLTAVGGMLRSLRQEDRAYRVGGDEFALMLVETDPKDAKIALTRLRHEAQKKLLGATLSIGYVNLTEAQLDQEPYELADTALYEAKRAGRNAIVCFDDISNDVNVFSPRKAELVRRMIAEEMMTVAFQPIWDIDSTRPLAFEALARPAAELGFSGPQEAFDIAERIRQVYELDMLCIRKSLASVSHLPAGSTIFLNVAPASLAHTLFDPEQFVEQLRAAGIDPQNVVIELTERRIDDQAAIIARASKLQALGVRMALDDTGSGHAGLEILSNLRLDFVKIDRSLLVKAIDDKGARGVLAGIIAIARETGSYLIAEGVENRTLLDFACNAHDPGNKASPGIRGVQGYLLGRPETGHVDLQALEGHQAYLARRGHENAATKQAAIRAA